MRSNFLFCSALAAAAVLSAADPAANPLPGMPPVLDHHDIYSADAAGDLSPVVRKFPSLVYVPNSGSNSVYVINPKTYKIVGRFSRRPPAPACDSFLRLEVTMGTMRLRR